MIAFVFVTGITSYGITSLLTGANNFNNITYKKDIHDICGFTKEETADFLDLELESKEFKLVTNYYNGYSWIVDVSNNNTNNSQRLFNPFSIIQYENNRRFEPYWVKTSNENIFQRFPSMFYYPLPMTILLTFLTASRNTNELFVDNKDSCGRLLIESGYGTIKKIVKKDNSGKYPEYETTIDYPNEEIKSSMRYDYFKEIIKLTNNNDKIIITEFVNELENQNFTNLFKLANYIRGSLINFKHFPYNKEKNWYKLITIILKMTNQIFVIEDFSDILLYGSQKVSYIIKMKIFDLNFNNPKLSDEKLLEKLRKIGNEAINQILLNNYIIMNSFYKL